MGYSLDEAVRATLKRNEEVIGESDKTITTYRVSVKCGRGDVKSLLGLVNLKENRVLSEPRFSNIGDFVDDVASFEIGDKVGYIRADGTYLMPPTDEYVEAKTPIEGICRLKTHDNTWRLMDFHGKFFADGDYDSVGIIPSAKNVLNIPLILAKRDEHFVLLKNDGSVILGGEASTELELFSPSVVWKKSLDSSEALFDLTKNEYLVDLVYDIVDKGDGLITYHEIEPGMGAYLGNRCVLAQVNENGLEVLVSNFQNYKHISRNLMACENSTRGNGVLTKIYNLERKEFSSIGEIAGYHVLKRVKSRHWSFMQKGLTGVFDQNGNVVIKPIVEELHESSENKVKVVVNGLVGIFDVEAKEWVVLPQYDEVMGPDAMGMYCVGEVTEAKGFWEKETIEWKYIRSNGMPLFSKWNFEKAGPFNSKGYAEVVILGGPKGRLDKNGEFTKV